MSKPTIVIIAYNREKSLQRLLNSLARASYPSEQITLHISIDSSNNAKVKELADNFDWKFGEKIVDLKPQNLGLIKHVLSCGELTNDYESIVVLEDDLVVAPGFYRYAQKANEFYSKDEKIAGVSLFTYPVEESNFYPFQPIQDESDVHFIQVASSWGQSWTKSQWLNFKSWLTDHPNGKETLLPDYVLNWGNNSWKKLFITYLIDLDRYFVFPNTSYSSNFEEEGTHSTQTGLFQVPMNFGVSEPRLKKWGNSNSIYDVYFELIPRALKQLMPHFSEFDLEVDFYGKKSLKKTESEYLLTIRKGKSPVRSFGVRMEPLIQNVMFEIEGVEISLVKKSNILDQDEPDRFLKISQSIERLRQNSSAHLKKQEQVTIVIPALDEKQLEYTIDNLSKDRFHNVTILISCHPNLSKKFQSIEKSVGCSVKWIHSESSDINQLLRNGFEACTTNYVSWAQAGMEINLKKFEKVAKVFSGMKQVNFLRGIDEEVTEENYLTKNSAFWRVTPQLAYVDVKGSRDLSSELMVWRKPMLDEISAELKEDNSNLFIELLKATPLYVLVDQIGIKNGIESIHPLSKKAARKCLKDPKFKRNLFRRVLTHPYLFPGFYGNFPFIRFFYKEIGQFPLVIRYDFRNDSYFLANY